MVKALGDEELVSIVRHHHERLDGTGYPDRLVGEQIPIGARIISVADTFDAITSARPYRQARAHKKALDILKYEAGTQLDPVGRESVLRDLLRTSPAGPVGVVHQPSLAGLLLAGRRSRERGLRRPGRGGRRSGRRRRHRGDDAPPPRFGQALPDARSRPARGGCQPPPDRGRVRRVVATRLDARAQLDHKLSASVAGGSKPAPAGTGSTSAGGPDRRHQHRRRSRPAPRPAAPKPIRWRRRLQPGQPRRLLDAERTGRHGDQSPSEVKGSPIATESPKPVSGPKEGKGSSGRQKRQGERERRKRPARKPRPRKKRQPGKPRKRRPGKPRKPKKPRKKRKPRPEKKRPPKKPRPRKKRNAKEEKAAKEAKAKQKKKKRSQRTQGQEGKGSQRNQGQGRKKGQRRQRPHQRSARNGHRRLGPRVSPQTEVGAEAHLKAPPDRVRRARHAGPSLRPPSPPTTPNSIPARAARLGSPSAPTGPQRHPQNAAPRLAIRGT